MTTGTKVFLAFFALLLGVLILYYGVMMPGSEPVSARAGAPENGVAPNQPEESTQAEQPAAKDQARTPARSTAPDGRPFTLADQTQGILTQSVRDASARARDTAKRAADVDVANLGSTETPQTNQQDEAMEPDDGGVADPLAGTPVEMNGRRQPPSTAGAAEPEAKQPRTNAGEVKPIGSPAAAAPTTTPPSGPGVMNSQRQQPGRQPTTSSNATGQPKRNQPRPMAEYTIKSGDTMVSIAEEWFGDEHRWSWIAKANPLVDPARLKIGQKIKLPPKDYNPDAVSDPAPTSATAGGPETHVVQSGDTLIKIARAHYGDGSKWEMIYEANKKTVGADPAALEVGMKLLLPESASKPPSAARPR